MGLKLSEVAFDLLNLGDDVVSATGRPGTITRLILRDFSVAMVWPATPEKPEAESLVFHHQGDKITYIGTPARHSP